MQDITHLIERLEALEDRLGVRIESLHAEFTQTEFATHLIVRGELHPRSGTALQRDVGLVVAAYDSLSRLVGTESQTFRAADFFGFEVFKTIVFLHVESVARVRVYPKVR